MPSASQPPDRALAETVITTARRWLDEAAPAEDREARDGAGETVPRRRWNLAGRIRNPAGRPRRPADRPWQIETLVARPAVLDFVTRFIDEVMGCAEPKAAARNLERLSRDVPPALPAGLRVLVQLAGGFAVLAPRLVVPLTRAMFRRAVRHLLIEGEPTQLERRLAELAPRGARVELAPLGERVHGLRPAERRLSALRDLLARDEVEGVSVPLSAITVPFEPWAHELVVERVVERLAPLFEFAAAGSRAKRIVLEVERRAHLELTIDVFTALLGRPELLGYEGGIALPAAMPETLGAVQRLSQWATARRARGGSAIVVRAVKRGALDLERVDAELAGRSRATVPGRHESDANFVRLLDWVIDPQNAEAMHLGVSSLNLFDLAFARHLAISRGVADSVSYDLPLGATPQLDIARRELDQVAIVAPVVTAAEFAAAGEYLVTHLAAQTTGVLDERLFARDADAFRRSLDHLQAPPSPRAEARGERGDLSAAADSADGADLANGAEPAELADPADPDARGWAGGILARARSLASEPAEPELVRDTETLDRLVAATAAAGRSWAARPVADRAAALGVAATALSAMRGRLIEVLVGETGATFAEAEAECRAAVALARSAAQRVGELEAVEHAVVVPAAVTLIAPSWSTAIVDTVEAVTAALAAGSGVIVQPSYQARQSVAGVVAALAEAGLTSPLVTLLMPEDARVAKAAVGHAEVDRVVFTGDSDTALLLRSWRPERPPLGDVRGTVSVIVTESADLDEAVDAIVRGAFARGAQHPCGARLVILVGALGHSAALRQRLADAVRATHPAPSTEVSSRMSPLIATPSERVRRLLTRLEGDETWLVEPEALDDRLTIWRPGVRDGAAAETALDRTVAAPVIVLTSVPDLETAIALQNSGRAEAAGLHTRDIDDLAAWLDSADSPGLYVNMPTAGASVDPVPSGGWHGAGGMRGGPDRLIALGDWAPVFAEPLQSVRLDGIGTRVRTLIEAAQPVMQFLEFDLVRAGAVSDERAWVAHYRTPIEQSRPRSRRSVVRHLPVATTIRLTEGVSTAQLIRVLAAATRAGASVAVSTATALPEVLVHLFAHPLAPLSVESVLIETEARWLARVQAAQVTTPRIRLIGDDAGALATVLSTRPDVALHAGPVTTSGRLELLPFLRPQLVSMTAHRFGRPDPMIEQIEF